MRPLLPFIAFLSLSAVACDDGSGRASASGKGGAPGDGGQGGTGTAGPGTGGAVATPATGGRGGAGMTGGAPGRSGGTSASGGSGPSPGSDAAPPPDMGAGRDTAVVDAPPVMAPAAVRPVPSRDQAAYQRLERIAFFHFGPNTYVRSEFGDGNADPGVFNPTELDARQWMSVLKSAGFKLGMLTAKHHDGFCLWPTKCGEYNVAKSPWKNGQGDVIKEFTDAARAAGIKVGLYLSPLSNHAADSS